MRVGQAWKRSINTGELSVPTENESVMPTKSTRTTTTLAGRNYPTRQSVLHLSGIKPFLHFREAGVCVLEHHGEQRNVGGRGASIDKTPFRQTYQGRNRTRFVHILDRLGGAEVVVGHCRLGAAGHSLSTLSPWHSSPTTYQHCIFFPTGPYRDS